MCALPTEPARPPRAQASQSTDCPVCRMSQVVMRSPFVWPWQRQRGKAIQLIGVCQKCGTETAIIDVAQRKGRV